MKKLCLSLDKWTNTVFHVWIRIMLQIEHERQTLSMRCRPVDKQRTEKLVYKTRYWWTICEPLFSSISFFPPFQVPSALLYWTSSRMKSRCSWPWSGDPNKQVWGSYYVTSKNETHDHLFKKMACHVVAITLIISLVQCPWTIWRW